MVRIITICLFAMAAFSPAQGKIVECKSSLGFLYVSLYGAQATSWRPAAWNGAQAFFMSGNMPWGEEVHGGVPICWPWFGRREGLPIHGLVRYLKWRFVRRIGDNGVELETSSNEETLRKWPHEFRLLASISMISKKSLEIRVTETNTGATSFESAFGVHPYFSVADACMTHVDGEALPRPDGETAKFTADGKPHCLEDPIRRRGYEISATFADSWWVWNPGAERTPEMRTLAPEDWKCFWCLEALMRNPKTLFPGASRTSCVRISVKELCNSLNLKSKRR